MASSSSASGSSSNEQQGEAPAYEIKGRTMSLEEWELNIQSESPVDFDSLAAHDCDIGKYYEKQGLGRYFNLLNGPTYQTLVRHFWVRASIYDREAAKIEEDEKVLLNPELKGKSRAEMGLETFSKTQIRSSIMGIRVWITEDTIAFVIRRPAEGEHEAGISKPKDSPWNAIVNKTLYNKVKDFAYADMNTKTKIMLKIQNENLLPKGGGGDQPSLEHKILLHFVLKGVEANIPRYIFRHMVHQLRESQLNKRSWVPYGRLLSEIFHQGGIIEMLKEAQIFTDEQLGTVRGKIINGETLRAMHLIKAKDVKKSPTDLKPSDAKSDLIPDFPPICKQDPLEVQRAYIMDHYKTYNQKISLKDVPDQMYGGELPVAKSRKSKKKQITKEEYLAENATEVGAQKHKKAKKVKSAMSTILEEVEDLDDVPLIKKRTRSTQETAEQPASEQAGLEQAASDQAASEKPPSPKNKREAALQTIKRKRSNLTRNLKTAEGRRAQMLEELKENWDEDSSPKKAKRTATSEPIVMPSFEMTEEMRQYAREVSASKIAEKKRLKEVFEKERDERLKAAGYVPTPDIAALASELETVQYGATLLSQALKNKQASGATSSDPVSKAPEAVHPEAQSSGNPSNAPTNTQIPSLPSSPSSSSTESDDQPLSQHIDKLLKTKPTKLTDLGTLDWEQTQIEFSKNRIKLCEKFNLPPTHPLYPDNPEPVSVQQTQPNPEPTTNSTTQKASEVASDATTSETPQHQEYSTLHNLEKHLGGEMQPTPTKASKTVPEKTVLETQTETQTIPEQTVQEQTASEQVAPDQTTSDQTTEQQQQPDSPTIIDLTSDKPSTSHTTQTEPSPIPDHILESEYIEEQLIRLSDEIQALILRRTVPAPPIHYYDQWMDLQKSFDELLDQLRTKCVSSHSAMLKKLLDDMHEAAKEKELSFVPLLDITPFYPEEEYITRAARIQAGYKRRMREKDELLQKKDDQIKYLLEQLYKQAQP
ncbi:hypothetical protein MtrunA17_Chr5g0416811 [Medicago truncatula]|uniref:Uncharacterized protein n=1 Tax=Medicago truncatula TaxID=3880 RepID=A0A396HPS7_MEDTR|nr:hypothetical protein MtrunA17_Chr5g0416811 [Medicago truncatula]